jgi:hypothetical protein
MGQKCSCLCNKENDNTFNFYPESSFNQDFKESGIKSPYARSNINNLNNLNNENFSKLVQVNKDYSNNEKITEQEKTIEKSKEETIESIINANLKSFIKIQNCCKTFLYKKKFKSQFKVLKENQLNEKNKIIDKYLTANTKSALDMVKEFPFNPLNCLSEEYINQLNEKQFDEMLTTMSNFINLDNFKIKKLKNLSKPKNIRTIYQEVLFINNSLFSGFINLNKEKHGFGKLWTDTGEIIEGYWMQDKFTGYGRYITSEGNVLEGKSLLTFF